MPKYLPVIIALIASMLLAKNAEARAIDMRIYLVPAGAIDQRLLQAIKEKIPEYLPMAVRVEISPRQTISEDAYNPVRRQYDAGTVLADIFKKITLDTSVETALIITDVDLYYKDFNFVLGLADKSKPVCVISLARLKNEFYGLKSDNKLLFERALKESLHELGHVWGIDHCPSPKCVMYFSNTISDTDKKKASFCRECRKNLANRYYNPLVKGSLL